MKALMLSHSDGGGGAGRAAGRLFTALGEVGVSTTMIADFTHGENPRIMRPAGPAQDLRRRSRIACEEIPAWLARHPNPRLFSPGIASALSARTINAMPFDVVNLQWVNFGFLSIPAIGRITKPLTWSMHDMWTFTGGENYTSDSMTARWRTGYASPQTAQHAGQRFDVDRWVWKRKYRWWKRPITLIASSTWMAELAQQSPLTQNWPIAVIPNAVDTSTYAPGTPAESKVRLGLNPNTRVIAGFFSPGAAEHRKGFDLFRSSLDALHAVLPAKRSDTVVVIAGMSEPTLKNSQIGSWPTRWLGHLDDAASIDLYRAADVVVVPSRQDNSPQTATEALACGTPVVAFNTSGLPSLVEHEVTGYLADPFDTMDLAHGIAVVLEHDELRQKWGDAGRRIADRYWSMHVVGKQHADLFAQVVEQHHSG